MPVTPRGSLTRVVNDWAAMQTCTLCIQLVTPSLAAWVGHHQSSKGVSDAAQVMRASRFLPMLMHEYHVAHR